MASENSFKNAVGVGGAQGKPAETDPEKSSDSAWDYILYVWKRTFNKKRKRIFSMKLVLIILMTITAFLIFVELSCVKDTGGNCFDSASDSFDSCVIEGKTECDVEIQSCVCSSPGFCSNDEGNCEQKFPDDSNEMSHSDAALLMFFFFASMSLLLEQYVAGLFEEELEEKTKELERIRGGKKSDAPEVERVRHGERAIKQNEVLKFAFKGFFKLLGNFCNCCLAPCTNVSTEEVKQIDGSKHDVIVFDIDLEDWARVITLMTLACSSICYIVCFGPLAPSCISTKNKGMRGQGLTSGQGMVVALFLMSLPVTAILFLVTFPWALILAIIVQGGKSLPFFISWQAMFSFTLTSPNGDFGSIFSKSVVLGKLALCRVLLEVPWGKLPCCWADRCVNGKKDSAPGDAKNEGTIEVGTIEEGKVGQGQGQDQVV